MTAVVSHGTIHNIKIVIKISLTRMMRHTPVACGTSYNNDDNRKH